MCKMLCCRPGGLELITEFLAHQSQGAGADADRWACNVRAWFSKATAEERSVLLQGDSCLAHRRASDLLDTWLSERKLYLWVKKQNLELGIAPCTGNVMCELPSYKLEGSSRRDKAAPRTYRGTLQYLKRWRRRWGLRSGKIQCRDEVDAPTLREKAYHTHAKIPGRLS